MNPFNKKNINHLIILVAITLSFTFMNTSIYGATPTNKVQSLAKQVNGRLGIYAINTANGETIQYHARQRFPMCSTTKLVVVAAILSKSMRDKNLLNKRIFYSKQLTTASGYAPITQQFISSGMTIKSLCAAAMMYSDNAASNLLIKQLGGPKAITAFAHSLGNQSFRLDRIEPYLNSAIPGDKRDTSTPQAMGKTIQKLVLGNTLAAKQRKLLTTWLQNNTSGNARIRAGVPNTWRVGDKTGTGEYGTTNDIAVIWPTNCKPIIMSIYFTQKQHDAKPNNKIIAQAAHNVITSFQQTDSCLK